jgi:MFS family permease
VFPPRARAHASGIFHASSVLGTWLAAVAGLVVGAHWRHAYLLGVLPALLVLWVRAKVEEPEAWSKAEEKAARGEGVRLGSFAVLFADPRWRTRAILGMLLATVGLGAFGA